MVIELICCFGFYVSFCFASAPTRSVYMACFTARSVSGRFVRGLSFDFVEMLFDGIQWVESMAVGTLSPMGVKFVVSEFFLSLTIFDGSLLIVAPIKFLFDLLEILAIVGVVVGHALA